VRRSASVPRSSPVPCSKPVIISAGAARRDRKDHGRRSGPDRRYARQLRAALVGPQDPVDHPGPAFHGAPARPGRGVRWAKGFQISRLSREPL
jgi:hypothetical protein